MGCTFSREIDTSNPDAMQRFQEIERRRAVSKNGIYLSRRDRRLYDQMKPSKDRKLYEGLERDAGSLGV
jgi:ribosomal protein S21